MSWEFSSSFATWRQWRRGYGGCHHWCSSHCPSNCDTWPHAECKKSNMPPWHHLSKANFEFLNKVFAKTESHFKVSKVWIKNSVALFLMQVTRTLKWFQVVSDMLLRCNNNVNCISLIEISASLAFLLGKSKKDRTAGNPDKTKQDFSKVQVVKWITSVHQIISCIPNHKLNTEPLVYIKSVPVPTWYGTALNHQLHAETQDVHYGKKTQVVHQNTTQTLQQYHTILKTWTLRFRGQNHKKYLFVRPIYANNADAYLLASSREMERD